MFQAYKSQQLSMVGYFYHHLGAMNTMTDLCYKIPSHKICCVFSCLNCIPTNALHGAELSPDPGKL